MTLDDMKDAPESFKALLDEYKAQVQAKGVPEDLNSQIDIINRFNKDIADKKVSLPPIKTYLIAINSIAFGLDPEFIKMGLKYAKEKGFVVPHTIFIDYGVYSNKLRSTNILQLLQSNNFKQDVDYQLLNFKQLRNQGGTSTQHIYYLTYYA